MALLLLWKAHPRGSADIPRLCLDNWLRERTPGRGEEKKREWSGMGLRIAPNLKLSVLRKTPELHARS